MRPAPGPAKLDPVRRHAHDTPGRPCPEGLEQHDHDPGDRRYRNPRRHVVTRLRADGHDVRVLTRHTPPYAVDLREGDDGLERALDGTGTVVHCATSARGGDEQAARNLIAAARRAGVAHLVYISIVGVDRVPFPYYRTKLAVERQFEDSGTGWTVLRATQFHDLLFRLFQGLSKSPVMPLPARVKDQPVEVREVAHRLAELARGAPAGRVDDMGGPEVRTMHSWPVRTWTPRAAAAHW